MKKEALVDIITYIDSTYPKMVGPDKVAVLRTVASYYENVTQAEATVAIMQQAYRNIAG